MSIDSFFFVRAGVRNAKPEERHTYYCKHKSFANDFEAEHGDVHPHQAYWLAGGWIDEQYFFEDVDDARWFYGKGWKFRDFLDDDGIPYGQPPTALWIDDEEIKGADNNLPLTAEEQAAEEAFKKAQAIKYDAVIRDTFGIEEAQ